VQECDLNLKFIKFSVHLFYLLNVFEHIESNFDVSFIVA